MSQLPGCDRVSAGHAPAIPWVLSSSRSKEKRNTHQGSREQEESRGALWEEQGIAESRRRLIGLRDEKCWNRIGMRSEGRVLD